MGQGGGLVSISREAREEAERRGQEPGACFARETSILFGPLGPKWTRMGADHEVAHSEGSGTGLSAPCNRTDCEWSAEGLRTPGPGAYAIGRVCPRWVRLVAQQAALDRVERELSGWWADPSRVTPAGDPFIGVVVYERVDGCRVAVAMSQGLYRVFEGGTMPVGAQPDESWTGARPVALAQSVVEALGLLRGRLSDQEARQAGPGPATPAAENDPCES